jgi:hypothetical protein
VTVLDAGRAVLSEIAERVDRKRGWYSFGRVRGTITLFGIRYRLRHRNLYDVAAVEPPPARELPPDRELARALDGSGTDVCDRSMGAAGQRFGRNAPAVEPRPGLPDPGEISERLLARRVFLPADTLNLLAAAWVQFEVHDWMAHQTDGDALVRADGSTDEVARFASDQTHWWDASQLYGTDHGFADDSRADRESGEVKVGDALLETIERYVGKRPAPVPNLWIGLALFHLLFAHEHNAICAELRKHETKRRLTGDALYDKARLINAAVMAKIHTVEWTPAVIAHPTTARAIRATWYGQLGERFRRLGHLGPGELLSGIPGSRTNHDGVRYSLTEEFVAVYRMHPLIPDRVSFRHVKDDTLLAIDGDTAVPFEKLAVGAGPAKGPRERLREIGCANAFYSLGIANPGQISLHNYPDFLRALPRFQRPDGAASPREPIDLGARDIQRTRECMIPAYNDFRRLFRLNEVKSFTELAGGNEKLGDEISDVYRGKLADVDLMVGLFAERKPRGFAFSDTAFRVFVLMAARRLRSDRFFTSDFTEETYTATGMRWIREARLSEMLARNYPTLAPALQCVDNVFKPWLQEGA